MSDLATAAMSAGALAVTAGTAVVVDSVRRSRRPSVDLAELFDERQAGPHDQFEQELADPLTRRVLRALGGLARRFERLMPGNYVKAMERKLLLAGKTATVPAVFVAGQAALTAGLALLAIVYVAAGNPPTRTALMALVLMPAVGFMLPQARLNRQVNERKRLILADLPDTLDLLAISVEAGMGFEGALDVVCQNFQSPLADEFSLTLREMELGLPRRDAFQNLKQRTDVPELSNFVLALLQADALGIPIGRVLKTQAEEMRSRRRLWAREKAGKLPVKILFPLVLFIFPPILIVLIGPAAGNIGSAFK